MFAGLSAADLGDNSILNFSNVSGLVARRTSVYKWNKQADTKNKFGF